MYIISADWRCCSCSSKQEKQRKTVKASASPPKIRRWHMLALGGGWPPGPAPPGVGRYRWAWYNSPPPKIFPQRSVFLFSGAQGTGAQNRRGGANSPKHPFSSAQAPEKNYAALPEKNFRPHTIPPSASLGLGQLPHKHPWLTSGSAHWLQQQPPLGGAVLQSDESSVASLPTSFLVCVSLSLYSMTR